MAHKKKKNNTSVRGWLVGCSDCDIDLTLFSGNTMEEAIDNFFKETNFTVEDDIVVETIFIDGNVKRIRKNVKTIESYEEVE